MAHDVVSQRLTNSMFLHLHNFLPSNDVAVFRLIWLLVMFAY